VRALKQGLWRNIKLTKANKKRLNTLCKKPLCDSPHPNSLLQERELTQRVLFIKQQSSFLKLPLRAGEGWGEGVKIRPLEKY